MNKRGDWGSMEERLSRGRGMDDAPEPPPLKHCWVIDHRGRLPALLLGWRQVGGAWDGRVVRPVLENGSWVIVDEWLPSGLLEGG